MDIYYEIGLTVDGKQGVLHLDNKFTHVHDSTSALKWVIETIPVSYTHLRAHETRGNLVCRPLLEK